MKHIAFVAFGANLQEPQKQCEQALQLLSQQTQVKLLKKSSWFRSAALTLHGETQPDYCNGVACFETTLELTDFFRILRAIETQLGRPQIHEKWAPRTIDLDLLLFDQLALQSREITLPHPELTKRLFVLQPLGEIAPDLQDPLSGKPYTVFRDEILKKENLLSFW